MAALAGAPAGVLAQAPAAAAPEPPRILFEAAPRAVEYQLGRLSNAELVRVERNAGDPKYRPVYYALLTRKGLGREHFDEALAALIKLDGASRTAVLVEGLTKVAKDDEESAEKLLRVLFAQPAEALRADKALVAKTIEGAASPVVLRAGYGAWMVADTSPEAAWQAAQGRDGHLAALLKSVPMLGAHRELMARLAAPVAALLEKTGDADTRAAALLALASARPDAATFQLLAREVTGGADVQAREAAVRALNLIPREAWPAGEVAPLARAIVATVGKAAPEARTEPSAIEMIQLGEKLADALDGDARRGIRRELRSLGVRVVRVTAIPEQMAFDLKWFAVEAGKPVQIVLYNPDAMSHNLVVSLPGSLREVGTAGSTMSLSSDPNAKAYVPDSPLVLHATRLLNWGETARLNFPAPAKPGEYIFVCTFPGHWVRMYGVMLVVESLDAWEANRTVPRDPMTDQPFTTERQVTTERQ
jgi:azurin